MLLAHCPPGGPAGGDRPGDGGGGDGLPSLGPVRFHVSFTTLQEKLAAEKPEVALLINNAGCGYLGRMGETETAVQTRMVDLNVRAMTAMTNLVIPYMPAGGRILNTSSIASFCPTPRMTVYAR